MPGPDMQSRGIQPPAAVSGGRDTEFFVSVGQVILLVIKSRAFLKANPQIGKRPVRAENEFWFERIVLAPAIIPHQEFSRFQI